MYSDVYVRAIEFANYIISNKTTIRATAKKFNIAKSTVHYDLKFRLKNYNKQLYNQVREVLKTNFEEKHIRGGLATRRKYLNEKHMENLEEFGVNL